MEILSFQAKNNLIFRVDAQKAVLHVNCTHYYWISEVGSRLICLSSSELV